MSCQGICSLLYSSCVTYKTSYEQLRVFYTSVNLCLQPFVCVGAGATHLFLPEYDPVEEELQVLVCIINAKLLEAVEGQILTDTNIL